jgi:hypothetical protein
MTNRPSSEGVRLEASDVTGSRWRSARTFLALYGLSVVVTVIATGGLRALIRWSLS